MNNIDKIFEFATVVGKLKKELRFKSSPDIEGDTVASHVWRLTLLLVIIAQELELDINILKAVKIALIHDLPEAITGDIDAKIIYENNKIKDQKNLDEIGAIKNLKKMLPKKVGNEIYGLWKDYEKKGSPEARFVYSMDKIEGLWSYLEFQKGDFHNNDLVATYINEGYQNFPEIKEVLDYVKNRVKKEFKKRNIEWKKEYDK